MPHPPPLKRFGQNFLIDANIVRKIVETAAIQPEETVLEIGPGRGFLTRALCAKARKVIAIEIDRELARMLAGEVADSGPPPAYSEARTGRPPSSSEAEPAFLSAEAPLRYSNLDLQLGDALVFDYGSLPPGTVVVANLPYYVSTPLLFRLLETRGRFSRLILMLQTEVAERLAAKPASKAYGVLSVLTQYRAAVKVAFRVSPHCFRPRPTVGSAVVHLQIQTDRLLDAEPEAQFIRLARAAFAHRRKTLLNSLRDEGYPPARVTVALAHCSIAADRRAETLALDDYLALAAALHRTEGA